MRMEEKIWMEEKKCIIREYEKQLQKEHERATMMRFDDDDDDDDDDDEDELVRTMEIMLANGTVRKKREVKEDGECEEAKSSDHTFDKKSLLAHPKDGVYGAGP